MSVLHGTVAQLTKELLALVPVPHRHGEAEALVQDICRIVLNEVPDDDLGAISLLLHTPASCPEAFNVFLTFHLEIFSYVNRFAS